MVGTLFRLVGQCGPVGQVFEIEPQLFQQEPGQRVYPTECGNTLAQQDIYRMHLPDVSLFVVHDGCPAGRIVESRGWQEYPVEERAGLCPLGADDHTTGAQSPQGVVPP